MIMKYTIALFVLWLQLHGISSQGGMGSSIGSWNDPSVVGGTVSEATPYVAAIEVTGSFICGGSVIGKCWVLTAAHCCFFPTSYGRVRVGTLWKLAGGTEHLIAQKIMHENYAMDSKINDVALLKTQTQLVDGYSVAIIPMANPTRCPEVGTDGVIRGWGTTSEAGSTSSVLLKATLIVIDRAICQQSYGLFSFAISSTMFCAGVFQGGIDACQGDSGGPFVANGYLYGVISWGIGCGRSEYPGVYTKVCDYYMWVMSRTNNLA